MNGQDSLNDDLRQSPESLDDLISIIAHELRNPLLALRVLAAELAEVQHENPRQTHCARRIADVAGHLARTADAILDARRQAAGHYAGRWDIVDLESCCTRAVRLAAPLVKPGVTIAPVQIDANARTLHGDAEAVTRLVLNLLANAVRHTNKGTISIRIEPAPCASNRRYIRIVVSDDGSGIGNDTLRTLGFPFTAGVADQIDGNQSRLGVGLWLCRNAAANHGGDLCVRSKQGSGTTVYVHLADLDEPPLVRSVPRIRVLEPGTSPPQPPAEATGDAQTPAAPALGETAAPLSWMYTVAGIGGFALLTGLAAQISVPIPGTPVPMTLQTLPVVLAPLVLGPWRGAAAMALYILLGIVGLPIFADGRSGIEVLQGSTGGYLFGFIAASFAIAAMVRRARLQHRATWTHLLAATLIGHIVIWIPGVAWLWILTGDSWSECLSAGLWPFLPGALVKAALAALLATAWLNWRRSRPTIR